MPYCYPDVDRECCLTCHYFDSPRRIVVMGGKVFIEHEETSGTCRLSHDHRGAPVSRNWGFRPSPNSFGCHYKRWIELP